MTIPDFWIVLCKSSVADSDIWLSGWCSSRAPSSSFVFATSSSSTGWLGSTPWLTSPLLLGSSKHDRIAAGDLIETSWSCLWLEFILHAAHRRLATDFHDHGVKLCSRSGPQNLVLTVILWFRSLWCYTSANLWPNLDVFSSYYWMLTWRGCGRGPGRC